MYVIKYKQTESVLSDTITQMWDNHTYIPPSQSTCVITRVEISLFSVCRSIMSTELYAAIWASEVEHKTRSEFMWVDEISFTFSIIRKHRSISRPVKGRTGKETDYVEKWVLFSYSAYVGNTGEREGMLLKILSSSLFPSLPLSLSPGSSQRLGFCACQHFCAAWEQMFLFYIQMIFAIEVKKSIILFLLSRDKFARL